MNRRLVYLSTFAAVLLISAMAYGQGQRGQGQRGQGQGGRRGAMGRSMNVAQLLTNDAVKKELGISEEQSTKLSELLTTDRQQRGNFRDMSREEREKASAERTKTREKQEKQIAEILNEKQAKRLQEIRVQAMGIGALANEKIAKELGITDEQKTQLAKINTDSREKMRAAMSGDERPDREAMTKMRQETEAAAMKVLTKEQTAKLAKMKGKAFDLPRTRGQQGRGRRTDN